MKQRFFSIVLAVAATAFANEEFTARIDDQALVGLTVSQALHRAKVKPKSAILYTEPFGVPRGLGGPDERGDHVFLFFRRGGRPLDLRTEGAAERYAEETVVGVARVVGREQSCVGEVVWHFCLKPAP